MTQIVIPDPNLILATIAMGSLLFGIYNYFRNPQIKTDQVTLKLRDDLNEVQKQVTEIKETHIRSVEIDIKTLTTAVNDLSKTVIKLSTIIDERIPKQI